MHTATVLRSLALAGLTATLAALPAVADGDRGARSGADP